MLKKILMVSISMICSSALSARSDLPTNEKIGEMCAYTNNPALIQDFVISFMTNIWWDSTSYTTEEIERVQTCLYSNVIAYTKANVLTNQVHRRIGNSEHRYLMRVVFQFPCFHQNTNAIYEIADYIGTFHVLTEDEYMSIIRAAIKKDFGWDWSETCSFARTNGWAQIKAGAHYKEMATIWGPQWKNRYNISKYRSNLLSIFNSSAFEGMEKTFHGEELVTICSNFVWRARLSKEEEKAAFRSRIR